MHERRRELSARLRLREREAAGGSVRRRTDKHTFGVRVPFVALTPVMLLIGAWLCQNKRVLLVVCQVHLNKDERERQLSEPTQNV